MQGAMLECGILNAFFNARNTAKLIKPPFLGWMQKSHGQISPELTDMWFLSLFV